MKLLAGFHAAFAAVSMETNEGCILLVSREEDGPSTHACSPSLVVSRRGAAELSHALPCGVTARPCRSGLPALAWRRETTTMRMQCLDACSACVGGRGAWLLANAAETCFSLELGVGWVDWSGTAGDWQVDLGKAPSKSQGKHV